MTGKNDDSVFTQITETKESYGVPPSSIRTKWVYKPGSKQSPAFGDAWWSMPAEFRFVLQILAGLVKFPFVLLSALFSASLWLAKFQRRRMQQFAPDAQSEANDRD